MRAAEQIIILLGGASNPPAPPNTLVAGRGTFNLTGVDMAPEIDRVFSVDAGTFIQTGVSAGLLYARSMPAAVGSFAFTGVAANLVYTPVGSYAGPGDVFGSAWAWYSPARAYSAAFAAGGTAIMDLVDQAGSNPITINILSTGFVDVTSISNWVTAHSVTTIKVKQLYDQTGNGRHVLQATLANMPVLVLSSDPTGSLPTVDFNQGTISSLQTASTFTIAQPMTYSVVQNRTNGTAQGGMIGAANGATYAGFGSGASLALASAGAFVTKAATDASWYALQALINGTSSSAINVNNSDLAGQSAGTQSWSATAMRLGRAAAIQATGKFAEGGMWTVTSTATDRGNLYANQHGASGYNGGV